MARVTGKLQITLPKAVAERCGIRVGDELEVRQVGPSIRLDRASGVDAGPLRQERVAHFDRATRRQRSRQMGSRVRPPSSRGWTREELYARGRDR